MAWPGQLTDLLGAHNYWYVMFEPCDLARMSGFWGVLNDYSRKMHLPTMTIPQLDLWGSGYAGGGFMTYLVSTGIDAPPGKQYTISVWMRTETTLRIDTPKMGVAPSGG